MVTNAPAQPPPSAVDTAESDGDALMSALRNGDSGALAELWVQHAPRARALSWALSTTFDPDDVVAEAFARILHSVRAGKGPRQNFGAYLRAAVRSTIISWSRRAIDTRLSEDQWASIPDEAPLFDALDRIEVQRVFGLLSLSRQRALWLAEVEGYSTREIGAYLDITPNAAGVLLHRARRDLKTRWLAQTDQTTPDKLAV